MISLIGGKAIVSRGLRIVARNAFPPFICEAQLNVRTGLPLRGRAAVPLNRLDLILRCAELAKTEGPPNKNLSPRVSRLG